MRRVLLIAVLAWLVAAPAPAQTTAPAWDFSASYSFLRDYDLDETLNGFVVSGGLGATPLVSFVGELGGHYKTLRRRGVDIDLDIYSFMGGLRLQNRDSAAFTPYGQLLLGAVHARAEATGDSDSDTRFALQPGAGLDWWFQPNAGVRAGVDYRWLFDDDDTSQFRFLFGLVLTGD